MTLGQVVIILVMRLVSVVLPSGQPRGAEQGEQVVLALIWQGLARLGKMSRVVSVSRNPVDRN